MTNRIILILLIILNCTLFSFSRQPISAFEEDSFFVQFTAEKRDLNRVRPEPLKKFLLLAGFQENDAEGLIRYRRVHGEFESFQELFLIGFDENRIEILKKYFFIESSRKSADEILSETGNENLEESIEYYSDFLVHPLNLNDAPPEAISALPSMDREKAGRIAAFREKNPISELLELTNAGISRDDLLTISPFITIKPSEARGFTFTPILQYHQDKTVSGGTNNHSQGYSCRLMLYSENIRLYFASSTGSNSLPYASWNETLSNSHYNALFSVDGFQLTAGHYKIALGQGLLFGGSFTPPVDKIVSAPVKKGGKGLAPYLSLSFDSGGDGKRDFFNGIGASYQAYPLNLSGFYPEPKLTAFYSCFDNDGLHRMTNQTDYGMNIETKIPLFDTSAGFTLARQERLDGKFRDTGGSVYYDSGIFGLVNLYGEYAVFDGFSTAHGALLDLGDFNASLLGYYSETNFNAPNGSDIIRNRHDQAGIFTGLSYDFHWLYAGTYADISTKSTNAPLEKRYDAKAVSRFEPGSEFLKKVELAAESKYSDRLDEDDTRTHLSVETAFFRELFKIKFQWQNLRNYTHGEWGNMFTIRTVYSPFDWLDLIMRWNNYYAPSYFSALFDTEEGLSMGFFSIVPYYGNGNSYSALGRLHFSSDFELMVRYQLDVRYVYSIDKRNEDFTVFWKSEF
jgi:hypothetical protein